MAINQLYSGNLKCHRCPECNGFGCPDMLPGLGGVMGGVNFQANVESWNRLADQAGSALDDMRIVSASATTFTDEEKAQMRQEAIKQYQDSVIEEQKKKDRERKEKAKKAKEKKPAAPVLVPDTPANKSEEPTKKNKAEGKAKAIQMNLFDI